MKYPPAPAAMYVKRARAKLELTQAELAEKLGIERRTVTRYERGDDLPRQTRLAIRHLVEHKERKTEKLIRLFSELEKKKLAQTASLFLLILFGG